MMKQTAFLLKSLVLTAMMGCSLAGNAQKYEIDHGRVIYSEDVVMQVDVQTFVDLGCGYAKDRYNVYLDGRVLENVDPATFRLKERSAWRPRGREEQGEAAGAQRGYFKTRFNVYYGEKKLDAIASSFVELGGGYAKDSFNVYYRGNKVEGAIASSFKYTGNGYGEDSFDAYYRGKKLK